MQTEHFSGAAVIGGGPAGLIAAETLSAAGAPVIVFDRMPSLGRKFLMAGRGGLNLTHTDKPKAFLARYGAGAPHLEPIIRPFSPKALRAWAEGLGQPTFVGTSGRVFPKAMKASPLLRAWLKRLEAQGVHFRLRRDWLGWDEAGALRFQNADGAVETLMPAATLLALGGASWPRLGADGSWQSILARAEIASAPLSASNAGVRVAWSDYFAQRFAGKPIKAAAFSCGHLSSRGEAMITAHGLEGGGVYALSQAIRAELGTKDEAEIRIDLRPDHTLAQTIERLGGPRAGKSFTTFLRQMLRLSPGAINLLIETAGKDNPAFADTEQLAGLIKALPIRATGLMGLERAISSAGGLSWAALDDNLMLRARPGTYAAGEMLDWDAPTGGYLLQACFSSGVWAAKAMARGLRA
jgi:uncharacterized flavoprotein (TIGR03862 family)